MNANNSSNHCLVSWNATAGAGGASVFPAAPTATLDLDGGSARQEALNATTSLGATPVNIPSATRLALALKLTGTKCASSRIVYGGQKSGQVSPVVPAPGTLTASFRVGTGTPSTLFARPNPPTATSRLASGSDMQVKWTGSAGGNVAFYRIYRDGQTYADRYDTCDVGDLTSAGGCDNGNNTFTYTDQNTGGTAHTYWVTAVYGTGASLTATMAESTEVAVP
jgi:hypothetical protein